MFLSSPYLEPFCHAGLFLGLGYGLEYFLGLLMYTINFDFVSKALYFCFHITSIWDLFALFCPYWSMFGLGSSSKTFSGQLTQIINFVQVVKCYLFVITSAPFGAFFAFLGPHWTIYEVWIGFKKKFWAYSHRLLSLVLK